MGIRHKKRLPEGEFQAEISALSHDGRGIAKVDNKTTFITGALTGEHVRFVYTKVRKQYDEGRLTDVLKASDQRVKLRCDVFGICGGCALQHLALDQQIAFKEQQLIDVLDRDAGIRAEKIAEPLTAEPWGYRIKARLGVKYVKKKDKVLIGFRERGRSFITQTRACPVLHPSIGDDLQPLASLINTFSIRDKIPQIELAVDDTHCVLVFRLLDSLPASEKKQLLALCEQKGWIAYQQRGGPDTVKPMAKGVQLSYRLPGEGLNFYFSPLDFIQVNLEVNRQMVAQAMDWLKPESNERLLDLFCGIGNFTLPLAKCSGQIIGVEGDAGCVAKACLNAQRNQIKNADFYHEDLYQEVLNESSWTSKPFDALLLDPPRSGAKEVLALIANSNARRVLYISCNLDTLASDAGILVNTYGYRLQRAGVIDMFPHTAHVESMALFEK